MTRAEFEEKAEAMGYRPSLFQASTETPDVMENAIISRDHSYVAVDCACGHEHITAMYPIRFSDARELAEMWATKPCESCAPVAVNVPTQAQQVEAIRQDILSGWTKYDNR